MNRKNLKILAAIFAANFFAANLFALDVYISGKEYNSYKIILSEYEEEKRGYDVEKFNSKEFLESLDSEPQIEGAVDDDGLMRITDMKAYSESQKRRREWKNLKREYENYQRFIKQEKEFRESGYSNFFGIIEQRAIEALSKNKYSGINFKQGGRKEENFPCIELEFDSGYQSITTLKYTIHYSKAESKNYSVDFFKDTMERRDKSDIPYIADFCVKTVESVLPFIAFDSAKLAEPKPAANQSEYFYIDTIDLSNYLSKEVASASSQIGMSVAVNDDNSFAVKFDKAVRLFDANGNIKADYEKALSNLGIKSLGELYVCAIDSKLNIFSSKDYSKSYVFENEKYLRQANFFGASAANPWVIKNGSVDGYPVLWNYSDGSVIHSGKDIESSAVFNFAKFPNYAMVKISKEGELVKSGSSALCYFDKNGNAKKIITMRDKNDNIGIVQLAFLGEDFFIISDERGGKNCYSIYSYSGECLCSIPRQGFLSGFEFSACKNGILYFTSFAGGSKKLCRVGTNKFSGPEFLKQIAAANAKINVNPFEAKNYKELYELYSKNGGGQLAYSALAKYLDLSPADSKAAEKKLRLELALQKDTIKEEIQGVLDLYDEYGEMNATQKFIEVSAKIERLLKQFPNEDEIKKQFNELLDVFGKSSSAVQTNTKDLVVQEIDLAVLFPVLKNVYAKEACGNITLKNESDKTLTNISVSTNIRKYMDYPSESKSVAKLEKGKACNIDLFVPLNDAALNIQENTNVQIQYTINWECDGKKNKLNITRPVTIYKKSAMCWNDSAMLSCFILPNNAAVSQFAANAMSLEKQNIVLNKNINVAATLVDALGSIPLTYFSDPNISFSNIVDNNYAVDTVRFPNETLKIKGGDCDDMTTLFCSVLESVGISSAIITVPGHILAAFDAGESVNSIWQKLNADSKLKIIEHNGKIFIPIETTVMNKGFMECWKSASKHIAKKDAVEEFIVIAEQRENYPPVMVESAAEKIAFNSQNAAQQKQSDQTSAKNIFGGILSELAAKSNNGAELNSIAKMYKSLGNIDSAIETLTRALQVDKNYAPAYKNLAALYKIQGKNNLYITILDSMPKQKNSPQGGGTTTARASNAEDGWEE